MNIRCRLIAILVGAAAGPGICAADREAGSRAVADTCA